MKSGDTGPVMNHLLRKYVFLIVAIVLIGIGTDLLWTFQKIDYNLKDYSEDLTAPIARTGVHRRRKYIDNNENNDPAFGKVEAKVKQEFDSKWANALVRPWTGGPYSLHNDSLRDPSNGESYFMLKEYFKFKIQGFFIEYRAFDGETGSRTLLMEREYGWHGLLIEPHPVEYQRLILKNRKSWTSNVCLAIKNGTHSMKLVGNDMFDGRNDLRHVPKWSKVHTIQCRSLEELIASSANYTKLEDVVVDFFYLDAGGFELQVLRMIPIDKLFLKVISVKIHGDGIQRAGVQGYLQFLGYRNALEIRFNKHPHLTQIIYVRLNSTAVDYVGEGSP